VREIQTLVLCALSSSPLSRGKATHSVVTTGVVVGRILLAVDEGLRVEELAVLAGADLRDATACQLSERAVGASRQREGTHLVDDRGLEVDVDGAGHVLARARLGEEGREAAVRVLLVRVLVDDAAVGAEAVLEAVKLPAAGVGLRERGSGDASQERRGARGAHALPIWTPAWPTEMEMISVGP